MSSKNANQRVLESVGKNNYDMYMLITDGKEVNEILEDYSPVYQMYNYRHNLIDKQVLGNIKITIDDLKQSLEMIFLEHLNDSKSVSYTHLRAHET